MIDKRTAYFVESRLKSIPVIRRYANSPLADIIPLVFVLYAFYLDVRVYFDGEGHLLGYDEGNADADDILSRLYSIASSQLVGRKCREGEELYRELALLQDSHDAFRIVFREFMDFFILHRPSAYGSTSYPSFLNHAVCAILKSEKASSVYESGSGLGLFARSYDGWERYFAYESGRIDILIAELFQKLEGKKEVFYTSHDYIRKPEELRGFDTIIKSLLPLEGSPERLRFSRNGSRLDMIDLLDSLFQLDSWKRVILIVDYNFCCGPEYETIRNEICSRGLLHSVLWERMTTSSGDKGRVFILLLNRDANTSVNFTLDVTHKRWGILTKIPVDELKAAHCVLEPELYYHRDDGPVAYLPGDVRELYDFEKEADSDAVLGDMIQFVPSKIPQVLLDRKLEIIRGVSREDFGKTAFSAIKPKKLHDLDSPLGYRQVSGPAVHILFTDGWPGYMVCRVDDAVTYHVPEDVLSFTVREEIDPSYLIAGLFLNESLSINITGLGRIIRETDYWKNNRRRSRVDLPEEFLFDILASRPVRIISGRKKQANVVQKLQSMIGEVVNSDKEYGVILVGKPLTVEEKARLQGWLINVVGETESIEGLKSLLASDREKPLRTVDAVIMDTMTGYDDSTPVIYKGLFNSQKLSRDFELPFIFYSSFGMDILEKIDIDLFPDLTSGGNQFAVRSDKDSLRSAVRNIRSYLDSKSSPDAAIKKMYEREISIAERLDDTGQLTESIVKILKEDFQKGSSLEDAQKLLNNLRVCLETVLKAIGAIKLQVLPGGNLGKLCDFLIDSRYIENKQIYILDEQHLMPEALGESLRYFLKMTNGGSHPADQRNVDVRGYMYESRRPGIYKACVQILLDVMCWFDENCKKSISPWYTVRAIDGLLGQNDSVQRTKLKDKDYHYYYIGEVHLQWKKGLEEGISSSRIKIRNLSPEQHKEVKGIHYYAKAEDYDII